MDWKTLKRHRKTHHASSTGIKAQKYFSGTIFI